jgi:UDP-galactopyranose mutase
MVSLNNWLVVGCGITGAILAERIASSGRKVIIIDKRDHIAGNVYDTKDPPIHQYGPHVFHTNSDEVVKYLSRFTEWRQYHHRSNVVILNKQYSLPFNLCSLRIIFGAQWERALLNDYTFGDRIPLNVLLKSRKYRLIGHYILEGIFRKYSEKQWSRPFDKIPKSIIDRLPGIVLSYDNGYFTDKFQVMPKHGYTAMVKAILRHPNITVKLNTEFDNSMKYRNLVYTGQIDKFFEYCYGPLEYRSLRFEHKLLPCRWFQDVGIVNYPGVPDFTRIIEHKHSMYVSDPKRTWITYEYPQPYTGNNEPYYPVPDKKNLECHERYKKLVPPNVYMVGRLAEYKYFDMDTAVANALSRREIIP